MRTVALSEVAQVNPRWTPEAKPDDAVSFVGMANLSDEQGRVVAEEQRRVREVRTGYTPFLANDLLVAKITPCFENGKIGRATISETYGAGSTEFHVVRPGAELDGRYALHFLRRPHFRSAGELRMTGSGGQRRVPADYVAGTKIPLPSMDEQQRIADILDKADALRVKRRETIAHLNALSQSIFHEMFGGDQDIALGSIAKVSGGKRLPKGSDYSTVPTSFPYIRVADLRNGDIETSNLRYLDPEIQAKISRYTVGSGDVIISIAGSIGIVAAVPEELEGANLTENAARIRPLRPGTWDPHYLSHALRSPNAQAQIAGHTGRVTIGKLALFRIEKVTIPLPSFNDQQVFATRVSHVTTLRNQAERHLSELDNLFASLQDRAFRGEL